MRMNHPTLQRILHVCPTHRTIGNRNPLGNARNYTIGMSRTALRTQQQQSWMRRSSILSQQNLRNLPTMSTKDVRVFQNIDIDGITHSHGRMFSTMTKEADARAKARDDHILGAPMETTEKNEGEEKDENEGEEIKEKRVRLSDVSLVFMNIHVHDVFGIDVLHTRAHVVLYIMSNNVSLTMTKNTTIVHTSYRIVGTHIRSTQIKAHTAMGRTSH